MQNLYCDLYHQYSFLVKLLLSRQRPTGNWQGRILWEWIFFGGFWHHVNSYTYIMLHVFFVAGGGRVPSLQNSSPSFNKVGAKIQNKGAGEKKKSSLAFPVSTVVRYEKNPWKSHHHPPSHGLGRRLKIYWLDKMRKPHLPESASHPWDSWSRDPAPKT